MNTVDGNAAVIAPAATTLQHPICSTPPIGEQLLEEGKPTVEAVAPAPVLITEQQVVFSTAAALPVRPTTTRWWTRAIAVVLAAMHRMSLTSRLDGQPRQDCPRRYTFLENACMAREMHRL